MFRTWYACCDDQTFLENPVTDNFDKEGRRMADPVGKSAAGTAASLHQLQAGKLTRKLKQ